MARRFRSPPRRPPGLVIFDSTGVAIQDVKMAESRWILRALQENYNGSLRGHYRARARPPRLMPTTHHADVVHVAEDLTVEAVADDELGDRETDDRP